MAEPQKVSTAVLLAVFTFAGAALTELTDFFGLKQNRLAQLEERNEELLLQNSALTVKLGLLDAKISYGEEASEAEILFRFMSRIRRPGWCKKVDREGPRIDFRMAFITTPYSQAYGFSFDYYVGKTDTEVYPPEIAEVYRNRDLQTLRRRDFEQFDEPVQYANGVRSVEKMWKFWHQLSDGAEFICGWQLTWKLSDLPGVPVSLVEDDVALHRGRDWYMPRR